MLNTPKENEAQTIKLKMMDLKNIPDGSVCAFFGKRKSGKSFAIRDLIYHKKYFPMGQIVSGSESANPFYHDFFPSSYIIDEYSEQIIKNIIKRQIKIKKFAEQEKKENIKNSREVDTRFLIVLDDCLHDSSWQKTKSIKNIFMNGRHFGIFFILAIHYVAGIPPNLRSNIDYIFIFRDYSIQNRRKLYENFGGSIPSFALFCALMDNLDKYECLVICTDANKISFEDQVMYFKSTIRKNFKFGCKEFWEQSEKIKQLRLEMQEEEEKKQTSHKNSYRRVLEKFNNNKGKIQIIKH